MSELLDRLVEKVNRLEDERDKLDAENGALRGLIAVIRTALDVPQAVYEDERHEHDEYFKRAAYMRGALDAFGGSGVSARAAAAAITECASQPITYRVYKPKSTIESSELAKNSPQPV